MTTPLTLIYNDAYLVNLVTGEREDRAFSDVDRIGIFTTEWRDALTTTRCYIIICLECQKSKDDLFAQKLYAYTKEFDSTLRNARAAMAAIAATDKPLSGGSFFTIDLYRS